MTNSSRLPVGAILAGGRNKRMGADKALLLINGRPLIAYVAAAINEAGYECVVVGRDEAPNGVRAIVDDAQGQRGPAEGLATALRWSAGRPVFLAATDQPCDRRPSRL